MRRTANPIRGGTVKKLGNGGLSQRKGPAGGLQNRTTRKTTGRRKQAGKILDQAVSSTKNAREIREWWVSSGEGLRSVYKKADTKEKKNSAIGRAF